MRLIDADALIENIKQTAEAPVSGVWRWSGYRCEWGCSVCNNWIKDELMPEELYNYCPNCGAKIERIV